MYKLALMCLAAGLEISAPLQAATIAWTHWTTDVLSGTAGSAAGTISASSGTVNISYTGDVASPTEVNTTTAHPGPITGLSLR